MQPKDWCKLPHVVPLRLTQAPQRSIGYSGRFGSSLITLANFNFNIVHFKVSHSLSVRIAQLFKSQVDLAWSHMQEVRGSNPGAGKLLSGFYPQPFGNISST